METQKVVFVNKALNTRLAGLLRLPDGFDLSKNYPAVVVTGPMLSVKEQAQSVYASRLTEAGYVTLVFDGTYFGESEGTPRGQELPDVKESDIEGAVDYLCGLPYVDSERIGGLGICGSGSYMSVAGHYRHRPRHRGYFHLPHDGIFQTGTRGCRRERSLRQGRG